MEQALPPDGVPPTPAGRRVGLRVVTGIFAAGLALGLIVAGLTSAGAQTGAPSAVPPTGRVAPADAPHRFGHKGHHRGGFERGMIHGEFTVPAPDGAYQTLAKQFGEVTAVEASSITVKSADGYSRTYVVDENTLVNAGRDGIADVKIGDDVSVLAIVNDGTANAVRIDDGTNIDRLEGRWMPMPKIVPPGTAPSGPSGTPGA